MSSRFCQPKESASPLTTDTLLKQSMALTRVVAARALSTCEGGWRIGRMGGGAEEGVVAKPQLGTYQP